MIFTVAVDNVRLVSESLLLLESLTLPEPAARPLFVVVSGLPGTGKSYFCRQLAERLPVALLESDALRKKLFAGPSYSFQESNHLFNVIHHLIETLLPRGISVILDATNLSEKNRQHLYNIADRLKIKLILVRISAPPELVKTRLQNRQGEATALPDADWNVYCKLASTEEVISRPHYTVDTSRNVYPAIEKIVREAV